MFTTDRDLLALEPSLFRDLAWAGQRLVSATGAIAGTTLTISSHDVTLEAAGVGAGHVALVDGAAYEVLARLSPTTATISRLRDDPDGPALPPSPVSGKPAAVHTFRPQIAVAHGTLLAMLGLAPAGAPRAGAVTEEAVMNAGELRAAESLLALSLIWSAAASLGGADSAAAARAEHYRRRFAHERSRAAARLDLDGDGVADATRRANVVQCSRA